jgi:phage pi2 protein 07
MKKKIMILHSLKTKVLVLLCVCIGALYGHSYTALAQEAVTFSVSPTIFDMTGTPGQTWRSTVRIINVNPFALTVYVKPANFEPKGEEGVPKFKPLIGEPAEEATLGRWISLNEEVIIGPEQTVEVPFTITVPEGATPGGHYAALMISTMPPEVDSPETKVQTSQVISSLIFLKVTGDVLENSSIRSFRTTNYLIGRPEATFELRIENKGNVHVQPQGEIKIFNMWGQERGTVPVNQKTLLGNVLPQSVRKFAFDWKGDWSVTDIGRYTAVATLAYGVDARQFMTADTAFWIIPWKFLLIVFSVVGGFVTLMTWAIKLYVRRMLALAGVMPPDRAQHQTVAQITVAKTVKGTRGRPKKVAEVVAPIEVGILDLRARIKATDTIRALLTTIIAFVRLYWKFFVVVSVILLFIGLVVWFFRGALTPTRDFEVTIESDGQSVTVTEKDFEEEVAAPNSDEPEVIKSLVPVTVINRSGMADALKMTEQRLQKAGFVVGTQSEEAGEPQGRTVIVYDAANEALALELSTLLDNALLSAFTANTSDGEEIVIYIGTDIENIK